MSFIKSAWKTVVPEGSNGYVDVTDGLGDEIAVCYGRTSSLERATFISAAPDMYETLKLIEEKYDFECAVCKVAYGHDLACPIRQALAKAEGKEAAERPER